MSNADIQWTRDRPGRQVSKCGRFAVESDGLPVISERDREGSGISAGITGGEWTLIVLDPAIAEKLNCVYVDEPTDWYPTMKAAKAAAKGCI